MTRETRALRVFDHKVQRRIVGFIAILLAPTVSALRSEPGLLSSISSYYWSDVGSVFVAALAVVAMFLFAYNGTGGTFDKEFFLAKFGGFFALIVALFPTANEGVPEAIGAEAPAWTRFVSSSIGVTPANLHIGAAVLLFLILAAMLLIFARRARDKGFPGRGGIYRVFAGALMAGLVMVGIHMLCRFQDLALPGLTHPSFVFYLEFYMLSVFGAAWLLAGFYEEKNEDP